MRRLNLIWATADKTGTGNGVEEDRRAANYWWLLAGEQEFAPAQYNLATQY